LLLCALGVLALSACGDNTVQSPAANAPVATSAAATSAVPDTLAFTAPRVGGGTLDMSQFAGTPVLLWFWAPT
jgi:hypothetical protein